MYFSQKKLLFPQLPLAMNPTVTDPPDLILEFGWSDQF